MSERVINTTFDGKYIAQIGWTLIYIINTTDLNDNEI